MDSPLSRRSLSGPEQAAIHWHSRLQGGDASAQAWVEFTNWLNADAANNTAYTLVSDIWDKAGRFESAFSSVQGAPPPASSAEIFDFPGAKKRKPSTRRPLVLAGGFGSAIAAMLLVLAAPMVLGQGYIDYNTEVGEQRTVILADGSTIMLNTNTRLRVKYGKKERHVDLKSGEAFFTVEHNDAKPFTVAVHGILVRDVGTRFDIRDDALRTTISVTEGIVDVGMGPLKKKDSPTEFSANYRLTAGEQAVIEGNNNSLIRPFDANVITAWKQGQLVFQDANLDVVATELNRYFITPVELANATLGEMHFTGVLQIHDQKRAVRDLAAFFALIPEYKPGRIVLYRNMKNERS